MKVYVLVAIDEETQEFIKICGVYSNFELANSKRAKLEAADRKLCEELNTSLDEFDIYEKELEEN